MIDCLYQNSLRLVLLLEAQPTPVKIENEKILLKKHKHIICSIKSFAKIKNMLRILPSLIFPQFFFLVE